MAAVPSIPLPLLMASHGVHSLTEYLNTHNLMLPILSLLLSGSLECPCMTIALIVMHMPGISSSLFVLWLCLDSQCAMNCCGPGLYSILILY